MTSSWWNDAGHREQHMKQGGGSGDGEKWINWITLQKIKSLITWGLHWERGERTPSWVVAVQRRWSDRIQTPWGWASEDLNPGPRSAAHLLCNLGQAI